MSRKLLRIECLFNRATGDLTNILIPAEDNLMRYCLSIVLLVFLGLSQSASAYPIDKSSFSMLPPHCQAKYARMYERGKVTGITIDPKKYHPRVWEKRIGNPWGHMHHYCPALKDLNQAKISAHDRKHILHMVAGNIEYLITHSKWTPANYWLLAEAHMKLAEVAELRNQISEAIRQYGEAIKIYPKNYRFYIGLSRLLAKGGNREEALKVVRNGLKQVPKSKTLKRQEKRLMK